MTFLSPVSHFFKYFLKPHLRILQCSCSQQNIQNFGSNLKCMHHHISPLSSRSTIYALSTASGMSAIAVVRISGPCARNVLFEIGKRQKLPQERHAALCKLKDPETDELLDNALTLWFPSPNSFTGEDVCELHIHGGVAVVKSVLNALEKLPDFRFAEPGEFTKRAFMAGKLDLTEVEGLADLLHAETQAQQKQALRQMGGALHKLYSDWTERVKKCLARIEAYIDFSEDQHLDESILSTVKRDLEVVRVEISAHLCDKRKGEKLRSGVFTVLVGRPNVGKSSLLNTLCQRDVAIVSSTAGTTRDIIESSLNLGGYLVNICDTAGIRQTCNSVEQEGVKRAKQRSSNSDLLIFIMEAKRALDLLRAPSNNRLPVHPKDTVKYLLEQELGEDFSKNPQHSKREDRSEGSADSIMLLNKIDLLSDNDVQRVKGLEKELSSVCAVSCVDGTGMNEFLDVFAEKIKNICCGHRGEEPTITQERHRHHLQNCLQNMEDYEGSLCLDTAMAADKLRSAMNDLGRITGKVRTEDILDVVFKDFCIGK